MNLWDKRTEPLTTLSNANEKLDARGVRELTSLCVYCVRHKTLQTNARMTAARLGIKLLGREQFLAICAPNEPARSGMRDWLDRNLQEKGGTA